MRSRTEHAARWRDDRELDVARAAGGQKLFKQRLAELAARDDDSIDGVDDLVELCVQVGATRDPPADLGVNVREEFELPHDRLRQRTPPHDEHALRRRVPPPETTQRRAE